MDAEQTGCTIVTFFDAPIHPGTVAFHAMWYPGFDVYKAHNMALDIEKDGLAIEMKHESWGDRAVDISIPWHHIRQTLVFPGQIPDEAIDHFVQWFWGRFLLYPAHKRTGPRKTPLSK